MNICLISPTFHPAIGGAETHVRTLAEGMTSLGHSVTVLTDLRDPNSAHLEQVRGFRVLRTSQYRTFLDQPDRVAWEESLFGLLREFSELLCTDRFDIIHAHCQVSALLAAMMKGNLNSKLIVTMHETQPDLDSFGMGRSQIVYGHLPYDSLIACSKYFRDQAISYGAAPERVKLVYYSIDLSRFNGTAPRDTFRTMLGLRADNPLVLLVGRFKARKGILEFVHAISQTIRVIPYLRGAIVGSCNSASVEYATLIQREIDQLGLHDIVTIIDNQFGLDEMPEAYAAADLVVQPSYVEGLGIAVLEAMAMRKPVIGTSIPGIEETIQHGWNGLLVPPKSSEALASSIIHLISNPDEASRIAENGFSFVHEHFSADQMVRKTTAIYSELLAGPYPFE